MSDRDHNEHGVLLCECKPYGGPHPYEPGEWCSPVRVSPGQGKRALRANPHYRAK